MKTRDLAEHVTELRRRLGTRRSIRRTVVAPGLELSTAAVPDGTDIELDLVLESIFEGVVVSGQIIAPWRGECRRCLGAVEGVVVADLREIFEVTPTEGETWPLTGDEIDLEPIVRDAVLLALPLAPLCDEACRGPAPEAFPAVADDAVADASVAPPVRDPRWAALDDLDLGD